MNKPLAAPYGAPLAPAFYDRDPAIVARALLGAVLRSSVGGVVTSGTIIETEVYLGPHDPGNCTIRAHCG